MSGSRDLLGLDCGKVAMRNDRRPDAKFGLAPLAATLLLLPLAAPVQGQTTAAASSRAALSEAIVCLPDKLRSERNRPAKANAVMVKTSDVRPPHPSVIARTRAPTKPVRFVLCPAGANQP